MFNNIVSQPSTPGGHLHACCPMYACHYQEYGQRKPWYTYRTALSSQTGMYSAQNILRTSIAFQTALRTNFCTSIHPLHPPKQSAASQTTSPGLIDIKSMLIQKKLTLKTQVREDALRIQREPRKKMKEAKNAHWEKAES